MTDKTIFQDKAQCPHCKKLVEMKVVKKIISEPVKGEYETVLEVGKSTQKTLEE